MTRRLFQLLLGFAGGLAVTFGVLAGADAATNGGASDVGTRTGAGIVNLLQPGDRLAGPPAFALALYQPASPTIDSRLPAIFRTNATGW